MSWTRPCVMYLCVERDPELLLGTNARSCTPVDNPQGVSVSVLLSSLLLSSARALTRHCWFRGRASAGPSSQVLRCVACSYALQGVPQEDKGSVDKTEWGRALGSALRHLKCRGTEENAPQHVLQERLASMTCVQRNKPVCH